ncbi:MAG: substrate-binding periplasmic protein [Dehalococcoidia bacterium]
MFSNNYNFDTLYPEILTIGTYTEFAPFSYEFEEEIIGSDLAFLGQFANSIGYKISIVTMNFSELWEAPNQNQCDIAAAGIMARNDRDIGIHAKWSNPYSEVYRSLLVRKDDTHIFNSLSNLLNKKIVVTPDSTAHIDAIDRYVPIGAQILPYVESQEKVVIELLENKIDAFAEGNISNEFLKNKYGGSLLSLCDLHAMDEKETLNFVVRAHSDHLWEYLNYFISSNQY